MFFHQKKGEGDLGEITGLMVLFRAVLSNQTFCNDGNVLYQCCPMGTCGY